MEKIDAGRDWGQEDPLEKEMATYSRIPAWRIPWAEEPGRLQSMDSQRVGHQGASRAAPGKSGLHARGEGERVLALESREDDLRLPRQSLHPG